MTHSLSRKCARAARRAQVRSQHSMIKHTLQCAQSTLVKKSQMMMMVNYSRFCPSQDRTPASAPYKETEQQTQKTQGLVGRVP